MDNPNQSPNLPQQVIGASMPAWGGGKTLQAAILAGAQSAVEGHNQPPLPVAPDRSLVNGMIPVVRPSSAGQNRW